MRVPEASPPRVYTLPPGTPFVDALAASLWARYRAEPLGLSGVTVLLPTRRACRALGEALLRASRGAPLLLPTMRPLGDLDDEDGFIAAPEEPAAAGAGAPGLSPAIPPLRRQLLLTRLVLKFDAERRAGGRPAMDVAQAARLAAALARFLDQVHTERVGFDALENLVPEDYAAHWQITVDFLGILTRHWPDILAEHGFLDPADRRDRARAALAARWRAAPPEDPVIAAGSTGSIPATAELLDVVARVPRGAVLLPGLDRDMDEQSWDALDATHPQFGMKQLLERIGASRNAVADWPTAVPVAAPVGRVALLGRALGPAATAPAWLDSAPPPASALDGLTWIDCPGPHEEAGTIALLMREALEAPGRTAALVTPDRALARRVGAELRRWRIEVDDSAGQPLVATPPGAFLRLTAALAVEEVAPVALLACLKHPLAAGGLAPGRFKAQVRALETLVLHGPRPAAGFAGLAHALAQAMQHDGARVPSGLVDRLAALARAFEPFAAAIASPRARLGDLLARHLAFAEYLAATADESGAERLWAGEAGFAAAMFFEEAGLAASDAPALPGTSYLALLESLLEGRAVRPRFGRHLRLHIWGPLEARLQQADLLILGGLNEGTWPPEPVSDPWLSRPMRAAFGLSPPERRIGLSAHDFVQAAAAPRVVLCRSTKVDGTPTVPARWLLRLRTALAGAGRAWGPQPAASLGWQGRLDRPDRIAPAPAPSFAPPIEARPRKLSVTRIETLMRDPYAVFARDILRLRPLDPLEADPGAAERGKLIHRVLERFLHEAIDAWPPDALQRLLDIGRDEFESVLAFPGVWAFWWPRFERIAGWLVATEPGLRSGARPLGGELTGELVVAAPAGPFKLTARADRIDVRDDGRLVLIDYKTGALPTQKDVRAGVAPQLPLEAAIAAAGGFDGLGAAPVAALCFWRLAGGDPAGEIKQIKEDATVLGEEARAGLEALIAAFDDPATPYLAYPRPGFARAYPDYHHLARVAEWSDAGAEDS